MLLLSNLLSNLKIKFGETEYFQLCDIEVFCIQVKAPNFGFLLFCC